MTIEIAAVGRTRIHDRVRRFSAARGTMVSIDDGVVSWSAG